MRTSGTTVWHWFMLGAVLPYAACAENPEVVRLTDDSSAGPSPSMNGPNSGVGGASTEEGPAYLTELRTAYDYGLLQGPGAEVKYLARLEGREPPSQIDSPCIFQNTRRYPLHLQFLQDSGAFETIDVFEYETLVLQRASRIWWGGSLKAIPAVVHPTTGHPGVIAYNVYARASPDEVLTVDEYAELDARLKACARYASDLLVLAAEQPMEAERLRAIAPQLQEHGVAVVFPEDLNGRLGAQGYSLGESYGYLVVVPVGAALPPTVSARDIVVAEGAPNDIPVVAGLVTANVQNFLSHVNLRLQEKGIPNAFLPGVHENQWIASLTGALVHLVVTEDDVLLEPAVLSEAESFWAALRPPLPPLVSDLSVVAITPFSEIRSEDAPAFGVKTANLGELQRVLPPQHRPDGFAVPLARYAEFVQTAGLQPMIDELLNDPSLRVDAAYQAQQLTRLRSAMREAELPPGFLDELRKVAVASFGPDAVTQPFRFRSSTNAEDLKVSSGAGLYDSRRGCFADDEDGDEAGPSRCLSAGEEASLTAELERRRRDFAEHPERTYLAAIIDDLGDDLTQEKPVTKAVRRVWSSLWNQSAFSDREHWGVDHRQVFIGIAVNPSFVMEQREAVAVTQVRLDDGNPLYRVVSQAGSQGVVRPADPTLVAEMLTFRRSGTDVITDLRVLATSSLSEPFGSLLWTDDQLTSLGGLLFTVHDYFAREVYPEITDLNLDTEIEVTAVGQIVVKQVRPYVGNR